MYLVESFLTIQGEGKFVGYPSYFFRFGYCNLNCIGFDVEYDKKRGCDSFYAVDPIFKDRWKEITHINDLIDKLIKLEYKPHIVLTGGEPLLNLSNDIFFDFIKYLYTNSYQVTIETNGTIEVDFITIPLFSDFTFSISPKLSNSKSGVEIESIKSNIINILTKSQKSYLKFVYSSSVEDEISSIVNIFKEFDIFIMPLGENNRVLSLNDRDAFNYALKNNLFYSDRIHIRVFDDKRGV